MSDENTVVENEEEIDDTIDDPVEATVIDADGNVISVITVLQSEIDARDDIVEGIAPDPLEYKRVWWNGTEFVQIDLDLSADKASWGEIKFYRNLFMESPIDTSYGTVDVDQTSIAMMESAIANFDDLPTIVNGQITWKKSDNTFVQLTKIMLIEMKAEVDVAKAVRGAYLFSQAEAFKNADPMPSTEFVSTYDNWIEP